jgi:hypothetical protein
MSERNFVDYEVRAADISEGQHGDPLGRIFQVLRRRLDLEATWVGFDNTVENVFLAVRLSRILVLEEWP